MAAGDHQPAPVPGARTAPTLDQLREIGRAAGLDDVAVAPVEVQEPARSVLFSRRARGLAGTMAFTYRNPERSTDPGRILAGATSMVVATRAYARPDPPPAPPVAGRIARYAWTDIYAQLRQGLEAMAQVLDTAGFTTRVVADSNDLVDRNAAWRAGLGWYGKNTNLLIPERGSWCVLGAVVTDAPLIGDRRPVDDGCGSCTACLELCPTGALVAPGVLDARRCIAWLVQAAEPIPEEFREAVGDRIYGCDVCQEVCPINRADPATGSPPPVADDQSEPGPWVDLVWVLEAPDQAILERYGRWYLANRDPNVVRRTALVALGNTADPSDPTTARLLSHYLGPDQPSLLRVHAEWAARRLGLAHLTGAPAHPGRS